MEVTVLGATGTAGRSALPVLSAAGHEVDQLAVLAEAAGISRVRPLPSWTVPRA